MLGSLFKRKSPALTQAEPTVADLFGDMPKDSFFEMVSNVVQRGLVGSASSFKIDWSSVPVVKPVEPDYAGLIAYYAYQLRLELDTDSLTLMLESSYAARYSDGRRRDRLAVGYAFYLFAGLYVASTLDEYQINQFIEKYKISLISSLFFDKSELDTLGVSVATKGESYFAALSDDKRENTKSFLEDIGKFFIASVAVRDDPNSQKFGQVLGYGTALYKEFERNLLNSSD
jgi:hypothetical protein